MRFIRPIPTGHSVLQSMSSLGSLIQLQRAYSSQAFGSLARIRDKKPKPPTQIKTLPILVPATGKTEAETEEVIRNAAEKCRILESLHLHQDSYKKNGPAPCRGYGLLNPAETECSVHVAQSNGHPRPIWMLFSGLGSQCDGDTAKEFMKIGPFSESINRSKKSVSKFGIDLDKCLQPNSQLMFKDVHASLLTSTAIQVASFDTMKSLGLRPDGFIGHSTGELLCAYADGCLSAQETFAVADAQGRACRQLKKCGMATIELSKAEVEEALPEDLEIVGANGPESVIMGGKLDSLTQYLHGLAAAGKSYAVIDSCGVVIHGNQAQVPAELLKKYLKGKIDGSRARSTKWISTSIPKEQAKSHLAKFASPEYFENNLRSPVRFHEALQQIPAGSMVIEMSPRGGLLQFLKHPTQDCIHISPMKSNVQGKLTHFYDSIGQLYLHGANLEMSKLYPRISKASHRPVT